MKPAQAGALTTPLPESCRAASSARIASRALWSAGGERGVRGVRGQQRRVGLGGLERRDAGVPASKLRCDEGLGGEAQQRICYLGVYLQRRVQAVHRGEQGGQRAGARAASRAAVVTTPRRAVEIFESTSEEVSTADSKA